MTAEVRSVAAADPGPVAVVVPGEREVPFGAFDRRIDALAGWLVSSVGIAEGDVVGLLATNRVEWLETYQAALRIGARLVPINWHLQADDIVYVLEDSQASVVVVEEQFAERVAAVEVTTLVMGPDYEAAVDGPLVEAAEVRRRGRGEVMVYTSGTTGRPKGVRQSSSSGADAAAVGAAMVAMFEMDAARGDSMLCTAPLYHSGPSRICAEWPLGAGVTVVLMDRFEPTAALDLIERHRITHVFFVPTMFTRMLAVPGREHYDVASLRFVLHGAGPCPRVVKEQMFEWFGPIIHEIYAASEGPGTWIGPEEWLAHPGSVGRADPTRLEIRDETGRRAETGEEGTVWFRGTTGFSYHGDPDKTASAHDDSGEWYTVGDRGRVDADDYLYLTGRSAEVIVSGGVNIYPARIDEALQAIPELQDGAAFGLPDDEFGEVVAAAVVVAPGVPAARLSDLVKARCRDELGSQMTPSSVFVVDELPRSDAGKLYRSRLLERLT